MENKLKQQIGIGINQAAFGLEKIYTLEKVDPKTIRAFKAPEKPVLKKGEIPLLEVYRYIGGGFPPLSLWDKIDRLSLPPPLLYHLKKEGWESIEEVLNHCQKNHPKIASLPHALQEILNQALRSWREILKAERVNRLDFKAYLRWLGRSIDPVAYLSLLHETDLLDFYAATPYERVQIERLSAVERKNKLQEALEKLHFGKEVKTIFEGLLFNWIEKRGGITIKSEIIERIEQCSLEGGAAKGFLDLLIKKGIFLWEDVGEGIWSFDLSLLQSIKLLKETLSSFFYRPKTVYEQNLLELLIQREFVAHGELLDPLLLKRFLLLSPSYRLKRVGLLSYSVQFLPL